MRLTVVIRITVIVITTLDSLPWAMATRDVPRKTAEPPASSTGVQPASPWTSGPLAATTPTSASTIPSRLQGRRLLTAASPTASGTSTPRAAIGETTPIVPIASAR